MINEHSVNFIEEREEDDHDNVHLRNGSQVFQKVNLDHVEEDEPDDIDILEGYLTYDMSEFHGMLGENIDFDLDDSDSDDEQLEPSQGREGSSAHLSSSQPASAQINHNHLPPSHYNIQVHHTDVSTQEIRLPGQSSGSDFPGQTGSFFPLNSPILEGEEMDPDIDLDMDGLENQSLRPSDDEDEDLNLFDSVDEEVDENNDPYRIMIRYPKEEYKFRDYQQRWLEVCPTYTLSNKLQTYSLQLERFTEMVKYVLETNVRNASGRRFSHGRTQVYFTDPSKIKQSQQNREGPRSQRPTFSSQNPPPPPPKEETVQESPEPQAIECTSMSVILFKSKEMYNQYQQFLHVRKASEQYQKIMEVFCRARSRFRIYSLLRSDIITLVQRHKKSIHFPSFQQYEGSSSSELKGKKTNLSLDSFSINFSQKRIQGLNKFFGIQTYERLEISDISNEHQVYGIKSRSMKEKNIQHQFHSFATFDDDE